MKKTERMGIPYIVNDDDFYQTPEYSKEISEAIDGALVGLQKRIDRIEGRVRELERAAAEKGTEKKKTAPVFEGIRTPAMVPYYKCRECGRPINRIGAKFCASCGLEIEWEDHYGE